MFLGLHVFNQDNKNSLLTGQSYLARSTFGAQQTVQYEHFVFLCCCLGKHKHHLSGE